MFHRLTCSVSSEVCNPSCFRSYYSNHNVVSSWLLLYVFTKAKHKTHEMTTQIQKDDSYCFDDVMQLQALPDIAHAGLDCFRRQKTAHSKQHRVLSHPSSTFAFSLRCDTSSQRWIVRRRSWLHVNVPAA